MKCDKFFSLFFFLLISLILLGISPIIKFDREVNILRKHLNFL